MTAPNADTASAELLVLREVKDLTTIPVGTLGRWHSSKDPRARELGLFKLPNGRVVARRSTVVAFIDRYAEQAS